MKPFRLTLKAYVLIFLISLLFKFMLKMHPQIQILSCTGMKLRVSVVLHDFDIGLEIIMLDSLWE